MSEEQPKLGRVHIEKNVIVQIVLDELKNIDGVVSFKSGVLLRTSGVKVRVGRNNKIDIGIDIKVQYGMSIPNIAHTIQQRILAAVGKSMDVEVKHINVNVKGIERGQL